MLKRTLLMLLTLVASCRAGRCESLPSREWQPALVWLAALPTLVVRLASLLLPAAAGADPGPVCYFVHADHLGSPCIVTSHQGSFQDHYQASVYGRSRAGGTSPQALALSQRYTGQVYDEGTGLCYYQARYYDPELANFIQPDTIVPEPGDPQSLDRYSYCRNDPLNKTDPSGHEDIDDESVSSRLKDVAVRIDFIGCCSWMRACSAQRGDLV